jgi:hypothetical protein
MNRDDEYRARAEEARKEADRSTNELDRARWLHIVEGWVSLLRKRPQSDGDDSSK